jgi:hypothetical protein
MYLRVGLRCIHPSRSRPTATSTGQASNPASSPVRGLARDRTPDLAFPFTALTPADPFHSLDWIHPVTPHKIQEARRSLDITVTGPLTPYTSILIMRAASLCGT